MSQTTSLHALFFFLSLGVGDSFAEDTVSKRAVFTERPHSQSRSYWSSIDAPPAPKLSKPQTSIIDEAKVQYDSRTGRIAAIRPINAQAGIRISPEQTARETAEAFLRSHSVALGLSADLSNLAFTREEGSLSFTDVIFQQVFEGVTVLGSQVTVALRKDRSALLSVTSRIFTRLPSRLSLGTLHPKEDAIRAAEVELEKRFPSHFDAQSPQNSAELYVLSSDREARFVWQVTSLSNGNSRVILVDANSNVVLSGHDSMIH
jgi:Zn-dependent metalloprotease